MLLSRNLHRTQITGFTRRRSLCERFFISRAGQPHHEREWKLSKNISRFDLERSFRVFRTGGQRLSLNFPLQWRKYPVFISSTVSPVKRYRYENPRDKNNRFGSGSDRQQPKLRKIFPSTSLAICTDLEPKFSNGKYFSPRWYIPTIETSSLEKRPRFVYKGK